MGHIVVGSNPTFPLIILNLVKMNNRNKLIAEFLGAKFHDCECYFPTMMFKEGKNFFPTNKLKFNTDWNWLMEVVKKIDNILYNMNVEYIEGDVSLDSFYSQNIEGLSYNSEDGAMISMDIEVAYKAVVKFVEWFNAEKVAGYEETCPYPTNWMKCPTWNKSELGCFNCPLYKKK